MTVVIGWPGAPLGPALAAQLGVPSSALFVRNFPDRETLVRLDTDVAGQAVVFAASLDDPDRKTLPLLFAADAAHELGARSVMLVAPYLAYMRQDVRFHAGEAVAARSFAQLLSRAFDALVTVDPHLHRIANLSDVYSIPAHVVAAAPAIAHWVAHNVPQPLFVGPDGESAQWVQQVAQFAGAPHITMTKQRHGDRDVTVEAGDVAAWPGRTPVLVDDIVSTGRTLAAAAHALRQAGLPPPVAVGVHALFDAAAHTAMLAAGIQRIVTCDTVAHPTNAISLVPQLAQAVARHCASATPSST